MFKSQTIVYSRFIVIPPLAYFAINYYYYYYCNRKIMTKNRNDKVSKFNRFLFVVFFKTKLVMSSEYRLTWMFVCFNAELNFDPRI